MKIILYVTIGLIMNVAARGRGRSDTLLLNLEQAIKAAPEYDGRKQADISQLKNLIASRRDIDPAGKFQMIRGLYNEYKTFNYDSAYLYAKQMQEISLQMHDSVYISDSRIGLAFIMVSAGLFKDAFDSLKTINVSRLPDSLKASFYALLGRSYYDLADFDNDKYYTPLYYGKGNAYLDSALAYFPPASFDYAYFEGLRNLKTRQLSKAQEIFETLLKRPKLSFHQMALAESTLSGIYEAQGRKDDQIRLLLMAAIDDIRSSTKETTATLYLSGLFFRDGDVKSAFTCVRKAIQDAVFYGARQRQVQVSAILPIIEGAKVNAIEDQKKVLFFYSGVVTLLLLGLVILIVITFRQNKKLKIAGQIITEANVRQREINDKLQEANKIKEEYMVHSYSINSDFFVRMEKFKQSIDRKLMDRKYDEIRFLLNNVNLKAEKEEMLKSFDKVFLRLFPDFVKNFNSLFREEDQIRLKKDELLNTDLRIFALMRMGITDNDKIAAILEYSVNTIYAYKARIKKKAIVPAKAFEESVMEAGTP
jgi:hypothetical protein